MHLWHFSVTVYVSILCVYLCTVSVFILCVYLRTGQHHKLLISTTRLVCNVCEELIRLQIFDLYASCHKTDFLDWVLKRHGPFVILFYCKIMLISISYNYCSVPTANFIETELNGECLYMLSLKSPRVTPTL